MGEVRTLLTQLKNGRFKKYRRKYKSKGGDRSEKGGTCVAGIVSRETYKIKVIANTRVPHQGRRRDLW